MAPPAKPPPSRRARPARPESGDRRGAAPKGSAPRGATAKGTAANTADRKAADGPFKPKPSGPRTPQPRLPKPRPAPAAKAPPTPRAAADGERPEGDRIAKLLARAGIASRREIERMIEEGRIAINDKTVETPATILKSLHGVTVDGVAVKAPAPAKLFMFHKPAGCLTAERDPKGRPTIYDRLPTDIDLPRLMPVGRLDYNTEGLLLLTNDGELKRLLELPSTGVERTYRARAFGEISQAQLEELVMGIEIDGMKYGRIDANLERRTGRNQWVEMTLTEGKNREVRRVLEHFDLEVNRLIRTRYGPFTLGDSAPGTLEEVRQHDLIVFRSSLMKQASGRTVGPA
ncbi:MAG: pseudouridine synthase [Sphingobium sp.]